MSSTVLTSALIAGAAVAYGYFQYGHNSPAENLVETASSAGKKNRRKKKPTTSAEALSSQVSQTDGLAKTPIVVPFPPVFPGDFDSASNVDPLSSEPAPKAKKAKKKKGRKPAALLAGTQSDSSAGPGPSSSFKSLQPSAPPPSVDTDASWIRVDPKRRREQASEDTSAVPSKSDAGMSASATQTEDEEIGQPTDNRRTLAEKFLPKPRKTGVEDMTETPDYPGVARVMRVQPREDEKPAAGFSWADYEDVHVDNNDADGEDDGEWGVVKSRGRPKVIHSTSSQTSTKQPESLTKKQRQNAAKRESQKQAKAEGESERLAALAKHKRELEKMKIAEQFADSKSDKKTSGGMTASVDERGKLIWE